MTFHHIIPENILHAFWNALVAQNHVAVLAEGLGCVVARGYQQLRSKAGRPNLRKRLADLLPAQQTNDMLITKVIDDLLKGVSPATVAAGLPGYSALPPENQTALPSRLRELIRAASGDRVYSEAEVLASMNGGGGLPAAEIGQAQEVVHKMLTWMPGNIHIGPTDRLKPTDAGFQPDVDDGGNSFETAAKQVLSKSHYEDLFRASQLIDAYVQNPAGPAAVSNLHKLVPVLQKLSKRDVTEYKDENWRRLPSGKWRLREPT